MRTAFRGYAGDCIVSGQIELTGERLSDALNESTELVVYDATLQALADGREVTFERLALHQEDLLIVEGDGPSGNPKRRIRTVRHALRAHVGPYVVFGELHALPGVDPQRTFNDRRTMIPLTNALVVFPRGGEKSAHRVPLAIVNGRLLEAIDLATDEQLANVRVAIAAA